MPMSANLANSIALLLSNNQTISSYTDERYLALHTENPTNLCTVGELSGSGYERTLIELTLNGNSSILNSNIVVFPVGTGTINNQITHFSIWDSNINGVPLSYGELTTPVNWVIGASISLASNAFEQIVVD